MTILKVEKIIIFQQVCCYGNSCELPFVTKRCARAAPAWVWGSSALSKHCAWQQVWLVGKGARRNSAPRTGASHLGKQPGICLSAQKSRSQCMKKMGNKIRHLYCGEKPPKLDNLVFLLAAIFSFLGNRQLTSRYLVTWAHDATWRQCPSASTCLEGLVPHACTARPHSLHSPPGRTATNMKPESLKVSAARSY